MEKINVNLTVQAIEKLFRQRDMYRAKVELLKMLADLSDDALKYVWRPVAYAYYWTDDHDMELLSEDDVSRYNIIRVAANDSPKTAKTHTVHGGNGTRLYNIWCAMKQRC